MDYTHLTNHEIADMIAETIGGDANQLAIIIYHELMEV